MLYIWLQIQSSVQKFTIILTGIQVILVFMLIHPSIIYTGYPERVAVGLVRISSGQQARGRVHPGQVVTPILIHLIVFSSLS